MKKPILLHLDDFGADSFESAPDAPFAPVSGHPLARVGPSNRWPTGCVSGCNGGCGTLAL